MDEGRKCHKIESVCVISNGNAKINMEEGFTPNLTTHEHPNTNHENSHSDVL